MFSDSAVTSSQVPWPVVMDGPELRDGPMPKGGVPFQGVGSLA